MAWDTIEFRDRDGNLVPEKARQTLLASIERALRSPDTDPQALIDAASGICANLPSIRNLAAYVNRSMFRATRRAYIAERKLAEQSEPHPRGHPNVRGANHLARAHRSADPARRDAVELERP